MKYPPTITTDADGVQIIEQNGSKKAAMAKTDYVQEYEGMICCIYCRVAQEVPAMKNFIDGKRRLATVDESGALVPSPICLFSPCPLYASGCAACKIEEHNMAVATKVSFSLCLFYILMLFVSGCGSNPHSRRREEAIHCER